MKPEDRLEGAITHLGSLIHSPEQPDDGVLQFRTVLIELEQAAEELGTRHDELQRTSARVEHERRRYREMFHFAPAGYVLTDRHDVIQEVNLAASRMLRIEPDRLVGKLISQFVPLADRKAFRLQLALLHDGQELHAKSLRIQPRDADPMTVILDVVPARNEGGAMIGNRWLVREKGPEGGVGHRSRRAHDMLEAVPVACILIDRTWHLRFVNRAATHVMGRSAAELLGKVLWDVFPEAARTRFADIVHAVMASGEALTFEDLYRPTQRWLKGDAFPSAGGICVFFQDITEERRGRLAEAQLAAIVQATSLGIISLSPAGVIESWNEGAQKLVGYRASEILGRRLDALVPEHLKRDLSFLRERSADHTQFDTKVVRKDGSTIDVSATISPMRAGSGDLIGYALIYRAASEQVRETKRLKEALKKGRAAADELQKDSEMKDLLLVAASHDMRAPLTVILGMAMMLRTIHPFPAGSNEEQLLDRMIANGEKLDRLLSDLLDLDRIARGHFEPERAPIDVGAVARRVLDGLGYADNHLQVEGDVVVEGDPTLIERIIENLVGNAAKFSGTADVAVAVREDGLGVLVVVDDRGPGVPDNIKQQIFEPFARGDSNVAGNGIGLSLVRSFAELHAGRAWVEDRPEGGASFRVLLAAGSSNGRARPLEGEAAVLS